MFPTFKQSFESLVLPALCAFVLCTGQAGLASARQSIEMTANLCTSAIRVEEKRSGKFYPSRAAAIRAVKALQRRGIMNIDVGCMQINLGYHPDAFRSLDQAFDPAANAAYAAKFLNHLRAQRRSWQKAVRFYHSSDPVRQRHYGNKVTKARQQIRLRDAEQRRNARIALAKARRNPQETTQKADAPPTVRGIPLSS